VVAIEL
jgi:hypothetical protein